MTGFSVVVTGFTLTQLTMHAKDKVHHACQKIKQTKPLERLAPPPLPPAEAFIADASFATANVNPRAAHARAEDTLSASRPRRPAGRAPPGARHWSCGRSGDRPPGWCRSRTAQRQARRPQTRQSDSLEGPVYLLGNKPCLDMGPQVILSTHFVKKRSK